MKALPFALATALLAASPAIAGTFAVAQKPADIPQTSPATESCVALSFNPDDTTRGFCSTYTSSPCSGRACQPLRHFKYWAVTWDTAGNVLHDTLCGTHDVHVPAVYPWVYQPGFDATTCYAPVTSGDPVILIGDYWYTLISTSADGAYEALVGYGTPYVYEF